MVPKVRLMCYHSVYRCDRSVVIFNDVGCVVRLGYWGDCFWLQRFGYVWSSYHPRIAYVCLFNATDSCCMAVMVEYSSCDNGALGAVFCKLCASFFAASMLLSADEGKGILK